MLDLLGFGQIYHDISTFRWVRKKQQLTNLLGGFTLRNPVLAALFTPVNPVKQQGRFYERF
jgi:hypothetical protein